MFQEDEGRKKFSSSEKKFGNSFFNKFRQGGKRIISMLSENFRLAFLQFLELIVITSEFGFL